MSPRANTLVSSLERATGGMFRSYVLGVMSPARSLCATPVKQFRSNYFRSSRPYTGGRFRSYDLWVISHNHPQIRLQRVKR